MNYVLAQANAARMQHPLSHPKMAEMLNRIDQINQLADTHTGFLWRAQAISSSELRTVAEFVKHPVLDEIFFNLSVWDSLENLRQFTYESMHRTVLGRKQDWIVSPQHPTYALWWIPADHRPCATEAAQRLRQLESEGPTQEAFDFKQTFPSSAASTQP